MKKILMITVMTLCITLYNIGQLSGRTIGKPYYSPNNLNNAVEDTLEPGSGKDTTHIKFKDKIIRITEDEDDTRIEVKEKNGAWDSDYEDWEDDWNDDMDDFDLDFGKSKGFDLHWTGFEIGLNNYVNNDFSMSLLEDNSYMELNTGKSWNVNLNFIEYDVSLIGKSFGVGTGMGVEFNDYRFDNQLPIKKGDNQIVVDSAFARAGYNLEKAKLNTVYITVPLIFEYQNRLSNDNILFFSVGMIGGMKLGSHTKVVYRDDGDKNKDKNRSDFFLSPFRYGYTLRAGYGFLKIFANYYDVPLFEKNKGPQLYPFTIGFMLSF
ncbi:MAG: outer membrane beta-barrel protein [Bacteroidales bacterium]